MRKSLSVGTWYHCFVVKSTANCKFLSTQMKGILLFLFSYIFSYSALDLLWLDKFSFRSILEQDGSAVDAAIATMFCNGIFTMQSMGLGGGFLMTIYIKENETAYTLNARETAPMKASPEMYRDNQNISRNGGWTPWFWCRTTKMRQAWFMLSKSF